MKEYAKCSTKIARDITAMKSGDRIARKRLEDFILSSYSSGENTEKAIEVLTDIFKRNKDIWSAEMLYHFFKKQKQFVESAFWGHKAIELCAKKRSLGQDVVHSIAVDTIELFKLCDRTISQNKWEYIERKGYGYEIDNPIKVLTVQGELYYINSLGVDDGEIIGYDRMGCVHNASHVIVDMYRVFIVGEPPEYKKRVCILCTDMYHDEYLHAPRGFNLNNVAVFKKGYDGNRYIC